VTFVIFPGRICLDTGGGKALANLSISASWLSDDFISKSAEIFTRRKSDLFDYKNAFPTLQSFELEKFVTIWSTVGPPYRNISTPYIFWFFWAQKFWLWCDFFDSENVILCLVIASRLHGITSWWQHLLSLAIYVIQCNQFQEDSGSLQVSYILTIIYLICRICCNLQNYRICCNRSWSSQFTSNLIIWT